MSIILDMLNLRCQYDIQVEMSNRYEFHAHKEIWPRDQELQFIYMEGICEAKEKLIVLRRECQRIALFSVREKEETMKNTEKWPGGWWWG